MLSKLHLNNQPIVSNKSNREVTLNKILQTMCLYINQIFVMDVFLFFLLVNAITNQIL